MSTRRIILARHGETELNRLHVVQGSGVNPGLNAEGRQQGAELCAAVGPGVQRLVTSGMLRASETVATLRSEGLVEETDDRLREICWGVHEGKTGTPELRADYKRLMNAWESGDLDARIEGGESAAELGVRLEAAWLDLAAAQHNLTFVCLHGRALRCLVCLVEGRPLQYMNEYPHSNAGYYVAESPSGGAWGITARNVTTHLGRAPQTFTT